MSREYNPPRDFSQEQYDRDVQSKAEPTERDKPEPLVAEPYKIGDRVRIPRVDTGTIIRIRFDPFGQEVYIVKCDNPSTTLYEFYLARYWECFRIK